MAQHNQTEEKVHLDTSNSKQGRQDVVNISKFKQPEQSKSPEISAFEQVMSQMKWITVIQPWMQRSMIHLQQVLVLTNV